VPATLFTIPESPDAVTAKLILDHKGIAYKEVVLRHPLHRRLVALLGTPGFKTPSVSTDGRRLHGNAAIIAGLEEIQPEPSLFPDEPDARALVEEARQWADRTLAAIPGRLGAIVSPNGSGPHVTASLLSAVPDRIIAAAVPERLSSAVPERIVSLGAPPLHWLRDRVVGDRTDPRERALAELAAALDHVDGLIEAGIVGGSEPNVADFDIAPRVRLLMRHPEVRRLIAGRPATRHALWLCPAWPD
jgi:glutathione S-transferase